MEEISTAAAEELHKALGRPTVHTNPGPRALINLPVLFWTTDHGTQTLTINQPLPGTIVATPTYTWAFPAGHNATGIGRPYDGTDPRTHPDHYVAHTYRHVGSAAATLAVDWDATITVTPNAPVDLDPVTFTRTAILDVVETTTLLTDS